MDEITLKDSVAEESEVSIDMDLMEKRWYTSDSEFYSF